MWDSQKTETNGISKEKHVSIANLQSRHKVSCNTDFRGRVPEDDLEAVLQPQPVAHFLQPLLGKHRQLHGGHPDNEHVSPATFGFSRGADEVIHNAECFWGAVVSE